jgi:hypothetical protein
MTKTRMLAPLKPGQKVANPNCTTYLEIVRRVRPNLYEVRLGADWHQPEFRGKIVQMQRNQLFPV